jgi:hypothetical protein
MLIDAIPFLDQHLFARSISKNQVGSMLLAHLHDHRSSLFPLMIMPHKVDLITPREIFYIDGKIDLRPRLDGRHNFRVFLAR